MNKKRISKTITFLTLGVISFVPLFFIKEVITSFIDGSTPDGLKNSELVIKVAKSVFIILGIIFLMVGLYELIMLFTEEERENKA